MESEGKNCVRTIKKGSDQNLQLLSGHLSFIKL